MVPPNAPLNEGDTKDKRHRLAVFRSGFFGAIVDSVINQKSSLIGEKIASTIAGMPDFVKNERQACLCTAGFTISEAVIAFLLPSLENLF